MPLKPTMHTVTVATRIARHLMLNRRCHRVRDARQLSELVLGILGHQPGQMGPTVRACAAACRRVYREATKMEDNR